LEEALDLSSDGLLNELIENVIFKSLAADGIRTPDRPPPSVTTTLATKHYY